MRTKQKHVRQPEPVAEPVESAAPPVAAPPPPPPMTDADVIALAADLGWTMERSDTPGFAWKGHPADDPDDVRHWRTMGHVVMKMKLVAKEQGKPS